MTTVEETANEILAPQLDRIEERRASQAKELARLVAIEVQKEMAKLTASYLGAHLGGPRTIEQARADEEDLRATETEQQRAERGDAVELAAIAFGETEPKKTPIVVGVSGPQAEVQTFRGNEELQAAYGSDWSVPQGGGPIGFVPIVVDAPGEVGPGPNVARADFDHRVRCESCGSTDVAMFDGAVLDQMPPIYTTVIKCACGHVSHEYSRERSPSENTSHSTSDKVGPEPQMEMFGHVSEQQPLTEEEIRSQRIHQVRDRLADIGCTEVSYITLDLTSWPSWAIHGAGETAKRDGTIKVLPGAGVVLLQIGNETPVDFSPETARALAQQLIERAHEVQLAKNDRVWAAMDSGEPAPMTAAPVEAPAAAPVQAVAAAVESRPMSEKRDESAVEDGDVQLVMAVASALREGGDAGQIVAAFRRKAAHAARVAERRAALAEVREQVDSEDFDWQGVKYMAERWERDLGKLEATSP